MTFRWDDRAKVTASAIGTGAVPAASPAAAGAFIQLGSIASIVNGDVVPYVITDGISLFENGYGTWNSSTGLTRTTVKSNSSRNNSLINFPAAVTVFCGAIAAALPLLDASGNMTISAAALLKPVPYFSGYLNTSIAVGTLAIDTVEFDNMGWWDAVNYKYTPLLAGKYRVSAATQVDGPQSTMQFGIVKNGTIIKRVGSNTSFSYESYVVSGIVNLNGSTDYVQITGGVFPSGNYLGLQGAIQVTWLNIEYVGP